jgi:hypothetical protein
METLTMVPLLITVAALWHAVRSHRQSLRLLRQMEKTLTIALAAMEDAGMVRVQWIDGRPIGRIVSAGASLNTAWKIEAQGGETEERGYDATEAVADHVHPDDDERDGPPPSK